MLNAGIAGSRPHEAWVHSFSKPLTDTRKTLTYKQSLFDKVKEFFVL